MCCTATTTATPSPWEKVPELADHTKCSTASSQVYSSLEECQQAAEVAGMPYVVYAPNGHCVIDDDCSNPITGTDWAFIVYYNTDLITITTTVPSPWEKVPELSENTKCSTGSS